MPFDQDKREVAHQLEAKTSYKEIVAEKLPPFPSFRQLVAIGGLQVLVGALAFSFAFAGHPVFSPMEQSVGVMLAGLGLVVGGVFVEITRVGRNDG